MQDTPLHTTLNINALHDITHQHTTLQPLLPPREECAASRQCNQQMQFQPSVMQCAPSYVAASHEPLHCITRLSSAVQFTAQRDAVCSIL